LLSYDGKCSFVFLSRRASVLVIKRCSFRSKQKQEFRSIVQFSVCCPRVALTFCNKSPFPFVGTLDCAFSSRLGDRNKHLPRAGQALHIVHGNHRITPYLPARRSSQELISFDPHCRKSSFHVLPKRLTTIGRCINRDHGLKQFLSRKSAGSTEVSNRIDG